MKHFEHLQKIQRGELPEPPVAQFLGFQLVEVEQGMVVLEMETGEHLYNPMGTVAGGIPGTLADAAMGYTLATVIADDEAFTTLDCKVNYLKPIWKTKLRAVGKMIRKGNNIALLECHIYDPKESLVAHATSTCMILRDAMAEGRSIK